MACRVGEENCFTRPSLLSCQPSPGPAGRPHRTGPWLLASLPEPSAPPLQAQRRQRRQIEPLASQPCASLVGDLEPRQQSRAQGCVALPVGAGSPGLSPAPWLAGPQPHPSSQQLGLVRNRGALQHGASHVPPPPPAACWVKARTLGIPPYPPLSSRQTQTGS